MGAAGWPGAPNLQFGVPQQYSGPPPWTIANFVLPASAPNFPTIGPFGAFNMLQELFHYVLIE